MKRHVYGSLTIALLVAAGLVVSSAVPSDAVTGVVPVDSRGGPQGQWSGGGGQGGNWHGGRGWHGGRVWPGGPSRRGHFVGGPRVFLGLGVGVPVWYPWGYAYPYPAYSPPVVAESAPPAYIEQDTPSPQYWYYCQSPQGYYPYVSACPGGWLQVVPQSDQPPQ
jgi:hypothetical protein